MVLLLLDHYCFGFLMSLKEMLTFPSLSNLVLQYKTKTCKKKQLSKIAFNARLMIALCRRAGADNSHQDSREACEGAGEGEASDVTRQ